MQVAWRGRDVAVAEGGRGLSGLYRIDPANPTHANVLGCYLSQPPRFGIARATATSSGVSPKMISSMGRADATGADGFLERGRNGARKGGKLLIRGG